MTEGQFDGSTTATRADFLWKTIARYDTYVGATLARGGLVASLGTFLIGGLALKWTDILATFSGHRILGAIALVVLLIIAALALAATALSIKALLPFLGPQGSSLVFFGDVARRPNRETYATDLASANDEALVADLCGQAHALAGALERKYRTLKLSFEMLFLSIVSIVVIVALRAIGLVIDLGTGGFQ